MMKRRDDVSAEIAHRAFSVLGAEIGLVSNYASIIEDDEYFLGKGAKLHSLLSNFHELKEIPFTSSHHAYVVLTDSGKIPFSTAGTDRELYISGPIRQFEEQTDDKRASLFGNMGLFSKFLIQVLEQQGIYSFHSTSFYHRDTNRLFLVLGGTGSGKSTVLLKAIHDGYEVFGTELTHVQFCGDDVVFHKGSVYQNCRVGNLVEDFPSLIERFSIKDVPEENIWHAYLSVDFTSVAAPENSLKNPEVVMLFPRIEADRKVPEIFRMNKQGIESKIYDNFCEKISPPSYVYTHEFVPTVDTREAVLRRQAFAKRLASYDGLKEVWRNMASPHMCLDSIL